MTSAVLLVADLLFFSVWVLTLREKRRRLSCFIFFTSSIGTILGFGLLRWVDLTRKRARQLGRHGVDGRKLHAKDANDWLKGADHEQPAHPALDSPMMQAKTGPHRAARGHPVGVAYWAPRMPQSFDLACGGRARGPAGNEHAAAYGLASPPRARMEGDYTPCT